MEKNDDKWKQFSTFRQPVNINNFNRNYFRYNPRNHGRYQNKHIGTCRFMNHFNHGREKGVNGNLSKPHTGHQGSQTKKNDMTDRAKEVCPWSEEAKEEERKRQLSATANKLMNKLKMWSTKKNEEQKGCENNCENTNADSSQKVVSSDMGNQLQKNSCKSRKTDGDFPRQLVRRLLHSSGKQTKKSHSAEQGTTKNETQTISNKLHTSTKSHNQQTYAEMRQKRIQQNLIGELMTLPKENLKKVLVDPKIHPRIERGMAQIVKENRLLLAQKFRSLAESKINGQGQFVCSEFVDDIGSLIDPDLAIDLCQLPPELIKQMGDIFQLDFESGLTEIEGQEPGNIKSTDKNSSDMECSKSVHCELMPEVSKMIGELQDQDIGERVEIEENKLENISLQYSLGMKDNNSSDMECANSVSSELMVGVSRIKGEPEDGDIGEGVETEEHKLQSISSQYSLGMRDKISTQSDSSDSVGTELMVGVNRIKEEPQDQNTAHTIEIEEHKLEYITPHYSFESGCNLSGAHNVNSIKSEPDLSYSTYHCISPEQGIRDSNQTTKTECTTESVVHNDFNDCSGNNQAQSFSVYGNNDNNDLSHESFIPVNEMNLTKSQNIVENNDKQFGSSDFSFSVKSENLNLRTCYQNEAEQCIRMLDTCKNAKEDTRLTNPESSKSPVDCGISCVTRYPIDIENRRKQSRAKESESNQTTLENFVQYDETKKSIEVQTDVNLIEIESSKAFHGELHVEGKEEALLEEVEMIDNLVHVLNQRRFLLFLKLVNLPSCKSRKNKLVSSLMQSVTNGDFALMRELSNKGYKGYGFKARQPPMRRRTSRKNSVEMQKTNKRTSASQNDDIIIIEAVENRKPSQNENLFTNCLNSSQNNREKAVGSKRTLDFGSGTNCNFPRGKKSRTLETSQCSGKM